MVSKNAPEVPAPTPAPKSKADKTRDADHWTPPSSDQSFTFESIDKAPAWIDRNWAGFDRGPALQLPAGDLWGDNGPYTTKVARIGDEVKFIASVGSTPAHFEVIEKEPDPKKMGTKRPPQVSQATLEDLLKTGYLTPDDLDDNAKAQVIAGSPAMRRFIEDDEGAPAKPQKVSDIVKLD